MSERVRLEIRDDVAYVTLDRPDKLNALDWDLLTGLVDAAERIGKDASLRAVILRGEGKAFCSGLDFPSFTKSPVKLARAFAKPRPGAANLFQEAALCFRGLPVPVIAVLHGRCYGGGLQIALGADFRFATPDCELSILEAKWGLVPDMSGTLTLRELLPMDVAMKLTMTGEVFDGRKAKELGLVTEIADDPAAAAEALVAAIRTRSPDSVAATKALFHRTWHASEAEALAAETLIQARLLSGANAREAVRSNLEKRAPRFRPRTFTR